MKHRINRRKAWIRRILAVGMLSACYGLVALAGGTCAARAAEVAPAWPAVTDETPTAAEPTATGHTAPTPEQPATHTPESSPEPTPEPSSEPSYEPSPEPTPEASATPAEPDPTAESTPETVANAEPEPDKEPLILKSLSLTGQHDAQPGERVAVRLTLDAANAAGKALQTFGIRFQLRGVADWSIRDCNGGADVRFSGGVLWVDNAHVMNGKVYVGSEALRFSLSVAPFAQDSDTDRASVAVSLVDSQGNPASASQLQDAEIQSSFAFQLNRPTETETAPLETDASGQPEVGKTPQNTEATAADTGKAEPTDRNDPADGTQIQSGSGPAESLQPPEGMQEPGETREPSAPVTGSEPQPAPGAAEDEDVDYDLGVQPAPVAQPEPASVGEPEASGDPPPTGEPESSADPNGASEPTASENPDALPEASQSPEPAATPVVRRLRIVANLAQDMLAVGDLLTLTAEMTGYEGLNPILQWQERTDGVWRNIEGAHDVTLTVLITPENINSAWRYDVTVEQ